MNTSIAGSKRPTLHLPKALLSSEPTERPRIKSGAGCFPTLSATELRRIPECEFRTGVAG